MSLFAQNNLTPSSLAQVFEGVRFRFASELDLQNGIEQLLQQRKISYAREQALTAKDRPDFIIDGGIALEVKIQGSLAQALRQINRYTKHPDISSIVVIGSPSWVGQIPLTVGSKPVTSIRITESLL